MIGEVTTRGEEILMPKQKSGVRQRDLSLLRELDKRNRTERLTIPPGGTYSSKHIVGGSFS